VRAYVYYFTFPIRCPLFSAKPVEDEKVGLEEIPSSNATSGKSSVAWSSTARPTGEKTAEVGTSDKVIDGEPEPTIHLSRAVPVSVF
jgi:hypothetical protein